MSRTSQLPSPKSAGSATARRWLRRCRCTTTRCCCRPLGIPTRRRRGAARRRRQLRGAELLVARSVLADCRPLPPGRCEGRAGLLDLRERSTALGSQSIGYIVAVLDVMRVFRRGDLEQAEALAGEALALGQAAGDADALAYYGAHLLAIRWVQGRLGEMVEMITSVMDSSTLRRRDAIYPAVLAYAIALRGDHLGARSVLDGLLADGVQTIPNFSTWTGTIGALVETAAVLGDGDVATQLAEAFTSAAHLPVMPSLAVVCLGPGERVLGTAFATAERWDEAIGWFRAALRANRRLRSRPFDAIIRAEFGCRAPSAGSRRRHFRGSRSSGVGNRPRRRVGPGGTGAAVAGRRRGSHCQYARTGCSGAGDARTTRPPVVDRHRRPLYIDRRSGGRTFHRRAADAAGHRRIGQRSERSGRCRGTPPSLLERHGSRRPRSSRVPTPPERARPRARHGRPVGRRRTRPPRRRGTRIAARRPSPSQRARRTATAILRRRRAEPNARLQGDRSSADPSRATDAVLGRALGSRIRTGYVCRYDNDPGRPIVWTVSAGT